MKKNNVRLIFDIAFFICALMLALSVRAHDFSFVGEAKDLRTGELLYTEEHFVSLAEGGEYKRSMVRYAAPDGTLIASKTLDFGASQTAPTLKFEYHQYPLSFDSSYEDRQFVLSSAKPDSESEAVIDLSDLQVFVVDGGFDRLLVSHWDSLLEGMEKDFDFLAVTRGSTIGFTLGVVSQSEDRVRFQIEPSSWLIDLLVEPIFLEYDRESRLLMRYEGLTNIALSEDADNVVAVIDYQYEGRSGFSPEEQISAVR